MLLPHSVDWCMVQPNTIHTLARITHLNGVAVEQDALLSFYTDGTFIVNINI
jgi:hypothetical protein